MGKFALPTLVLLPLLLLTLLPSCHSAPSLRLLVAGGEEASPLAMPKGVEEEKAFVEGGEEVKELVRGEEEEKVIGREALKEEEEEEDIEVVGNRPEKAEEKEPEEEEKEEEEEEDVMGETLALTSPVSPARETTIILPLLEKRVVYHHGVEASHPKTERNIQLFPSSSSSSSSSLLFLPKALTDISPSASSSSSPFIAHERELPNTHAALSLPPPSAVRSHFRSSPSPTTEEEKKEGREEVEGERESITAIKTLSLLTSPKSLIPTEGPKEGTPLVPVSPPHAPFLPLVNGNPFGFLPRRKSVLARKDRRVKRREERRREREAKRVQKRREREERRDEIRSRRREKKMFINFLWDAREDDEDRRGRDGQPDWSYWFGEDEEATPVEEEPLRNEYGPLTPREYEMFVPGDIEKTFWEEVAPDARQFVGSWQVDLQRSDSIIPIMAALGFSRLKRNIVAGYASVTKIEFRSGLPVPEAPVMHMSTKLPFGITKEATIAFDQKVVMQDDSDTGMWETTPVYVNGRIMQRRISQRGEMFDVRSIFPKDPMGIASGEVMLFKWTFIPTGQAPLTANRWLNRVA